MLHIVNGDVVGQKLLESGLEGEILVWREIYTEGPLELQLERPPLRSLRGQYLELAMGIPSEEWQKGCELQENKLTGFRDYSEIILWFEHDLFDQTMLIYLLYWLSTQELGETKLSLLSIGEFEGIVPFHGLGQLSAEQLHTLAEQRVEVSPQQLLLGAKAWQAYTSADPTALVELLHEEEDTSPLPFLQEAIRIHLSRFPSVQNGLGIVEQTTLEFLRQAGSLSGSQPASQSVSLSCSGSSTCVGATPFELFRKVGDKLSLLGMGDIQYWFCLRRLMEGPHPLIALDGGQLFPGLHDSPEAFGTNVVRITESGLRVLSGMANAVQLNSIDYWLGGVHLKGHTSIWHWDYTVHSLVLN